MKQRQYAFSLIEALIVLLLSSIILTTLTVFFLGYYQSFLKNQSFLHTQLQMHASTFMLTDAIQTAGYAGCVNLKNLTPVNEGINPLAAINAQNALQISHANNYQLKFPVGKFLENSDVVVIRSAKIEGQATYEKAENNEIIVMGNQKFLAQDNILIADCIHAELLHITKVFTVKNQHFQRIVISEPIRFSYDQHARIYLLQTIAFYVAQTQRKKNHTPVYALYEESLNGNKDELIEGIHNLIIDRRRRIVDIQLIFSEKTIRFAVPLRELI
jgi:hypothetical protein